jgi:uncharacterized protein with HEPN domain
MFDAVLITRQLEGVIEALERIAHRFAGINCAEDFRTSEEGRDRLDGICMVLIAVGEAFKQIDRRTKAALLPRYPEIDWRGVIGVRDVIAHGYFDVDVEQVFAICKKTIFPH